MKKFTIAAAAAALALASVAPAVADTKTSDDPFVSTQGGGFVFDAATGAWVIAGVAIAVVAAGDS